MQVTAHLHQLRMSSRKVRLISNLIQGMDVDEAEAQLTHLQRGPVVPLRKLLASAIANAEHNGKLQRGNLFIRQILVNQGPTIKRFQQRAFGRAAPIRKRTSHITIVLDERVPTAAHSRKPTAASKVASLPVVSDRPRTAQHGGHSHAEDERSTETASDEKEPFDVRRKGKHRHQEHQDGRAKKRSGGFFKQLFTRRSGER